MILILIPINTGVCVYTLQTLLVDAHMLDVLERCDEKLSVEALFALKDNPYLPPLLHWK